jgi:hypothetical protein
MNLITTSGRKITFEFVDNNIGKIMYTLIQGSKKHIRQGHTSFNTFTDSVTVEAKLRTAVAALVKLGYKMPVIPEEMTRDTLNRCHEDFHIVEEKAQADHMATKIKSKDHAVGHLFNDVNVLVHELENVLFKKNVIAYSVFQIGDFNIKDRVIINAELRKLFSHSTVAMRKEVTLHVGYATIGKTLWHAAIDNDVEVVKNCNLRPQLSISTETILDATPNRFTHSEAEDRKILDKQLSSFVKDNNLQDYVGWKDPIHSYCQQPVYAHCLEKLTMKQWHDIIMNDPLVQVEL